MAPVKRTAPRHRTPSVDVATAVVEAAVTIIGSDGADGITARKLAAEAGVAPMSIYNHFGDMHGVFDAVFEQGFTEFTSALHPASIVDDPIQALHQMGHNYRRFALDNPEMYSVMFLRVVPEFEASEVALFAAARSFDQLRSAVTRAHDAKRLRSGDVNVIAQEIWATCHGAVALEILGIFAFADPDATYNELMITLIRGLLLNPKGFEELV